MSSHPRLLLHHLHHLLLLHLLLLLLAARATHACPEPCRCVDTAVHCENRNISRFPDKMPRETTSIFLQGNGIRVVPPGSLDHLPRLRRLSLRGNPLQCDCRAAYLHAWLRHGFLSAGEGKLGARFDVSCAGPGALCGRRLALLPQVEVWKQCEPERGCLWMRVSQAALTVVALAHAALAVGIAAFAFLGNACSSRERQQEEAEYQDIACTFGVNYDIVGVDGSSVHRPVTLG